MSGEECINSRLIDLQFSSVSSSVSSALNLLATGLDHRPIGGFYSPDMVLQNTSCSSMISCIWYSRKIIAQREKPVSSNARHSLSQWAFQDG